MEGPPGWLGINVGDILQQAEQVRSMRQAREINQFKMDAARQQAIQEQQRQARLGDLLPRAAQGDQTATSELAAIDPELWMKFDDRQRKVIAEHTDELGQAIAWADTPEKWDLAVDHLSQKNPELAQYKGHFELRPKAAMQVGALKQFIAGQPKRDPYTLNPGDTRFGPDNTIVAQSPFKPEIIKDDQGNIYQFGGGVSSGGAPRGVRNNNAGNIEDGPFAQSLPGYAGSDGRFAKFDNPNAGDAARAKLLSSYIRRGFDTPAEIIGRWSPASENGASTSNYINFVAQKLGIGPNDKVAPAQIPQIAAAIAAFENGSASPSNGPSGGLTKIVSGGGKPKFEIVPEQEAQQLGLPPGGKYQRGPDGKVEAITGTANQGITRQQMGLAKMKIGNLRAIEGQLGRVERAMVDAENKGWTGAISGHVPGALDTESNVFDKSVRLLASLIRQLRKVPAEAAMSDYESRLAEMTLPSRTDTKAGRREALAGIRQLIDQIRGGYQDMLGVSDPNAGTKAKTGGGSVDDILAKYGVQ